MNHYLDDSLTVIYIDENLKSLSQEKIKAILGRLRKPTANDLKAANDIFPKKELKDIVLYATKKSPEFKKQYESEKRKAKGKSEDINVLQGLSMASAKQLKGIAQQKGGSKAAKMVDNLLIKLTYLFKDYGKGLLTTGIILKLISIYSTTLFGLVQG